MTSQAVVVVLYVGVLGSELKKTDLSYWLIAIWPGIGPQLIWLIAIWPGHWAPTYFLKKTLFFDIVL